MHKKIVKTLKVNNKILDNIYDQFVEIVHRDNIQIHFFQETQEITNMKKLHKKMCCHNLVSMLEVIY